MRHHCTYIFFFIVLFLGFSFGCFKEVLTITKILLAGVLVRARQTVLHAAASLLPLAMLWHQGQHDKL